LLRERAKSTAKVYTKRNRLNIPQFAARWSIVAVAALARAAMMAFTGTSLALNCRTTGTISSMQILKSSGEGSLKMVSAGAPAMISKSGFDLNVCLPLLSSPPPRGGREFQTALRQRNDL
jgi:hypothetical protein